MGDPARVFVFAKTPVKGRVKTRLAPLLGEGGASRFYRALLADTLRSIVMEPGLAGTLACDPAPDDFMSAQASRWNLALDVQRGGDLTEKLSNATSAARTRGIEHILFTGSDTPTLPRRFVDLSLDRLRQGTDVVLQPSLDGGYTTVGLGPRADPEVVFAGVPWDSDHALASTRENLERAGLSMAYVPTWYDIDVEADIEYLRGHLDLLDPDSASGAPETRRALEELLPRGA
jgi:rSAM/selenodomain-associated transferase 1